MGVEVLDATMDLGDEDMLDSGEGVTASAELKTDARRRLENKLEEMRLQRELRSYDFDF